MNVGKLKKIQSKNNYSKSLIIFFTPGIERSNYFVFKECGVQSTHSANGLKVLSKMSTHGDWPWHVALFKEDVHICDGTLVATDWVATTTSCFQGQPKAEWIAKFGIIRLFR